MPVKSINAPDIAGHSHLAVWNAFMAQIRHPIALEAGAIMKVEPAAKPVAHLPLARVRIGHPIGKALFRLIEFPFADLTNSELQAADIDSLPEPLAEAVWAGVLTVMNGLLPQSSDIELAMADVGRSNDPVQADSIDEWFDLTIDQRNTGPIVLKAGLNRAWLISLLAARSLPNFQARGPLDESLLLSADMTLGRLSLSKSELAAIEPGDVVIMAATAPDCRNVRVANRLFTFSVSQDQSVCGGSFPLDGLRPASFKSEISRMSDPIEGELSADEQHSGGLTDLILAVDFDIGRIEVPMTTVASWTRGSVVEMEQQPLEDGIAVTLRVNGQAVGTGDLVRIDDRIGVRITQVMS
ncbi:FliM/FliN family flagellar motor switch protein [Rhizobium oryzicola]|uniref:FliM/FliN family flagellar motor switch protein n=1 Tax=Rhizobium oryzicola TaxID=1232668 RepID=A0ABT8SYR4_9HYPH|nr:FliM/FliN family flagellar motor switch protein [Rhizobium oryzicola]MDO1583188.1 FliM/FliN family flagellar motor switch protein [Rhizobium oryzicola]